MDDYEAPDWENYRPSKCHCDYCESECRPGASMEGHVHIPYNYA
jgi:hypothetical protein